MAGLNPLLLCVKQSDRVIAPLSSAWLPVSCALEEVEWRISNKTNESDGFVGWQDCEGAVCLVCVRTGACAGLGSLIGKHCLPRQRGCSGSRLALSLISSDDG